MQSPMSSGEQEKANAVTENKRKETAILRVCLMSMLVNKIAARSNTSMSQINANVS